MCAKLSTIDSFLSLKLDFSEPINPDEELEKFKRNVKWLREDFKRREEFLNELKAKLC